MKDSKGLKSVILMMVIVMVPVVLKQSRSALAQTESNENRTEEGVQQPPIEQDTPSAQTGEQEQDAGLTESVKQKKGVQGATKEEVKKKKDLKPFSFRLRGISRYEQVRAVRQKLNEALSGEFLTIRSRVERTPRKVHLDWKIYSRIPPEELKQTLAGLSFDFGYYDVVSSEERAMTVKLP